MAEQTLRDRWDAMAAEEKAAYRSGRVCVERGCNEPAGTPWGPYWCPQHDDERCARIDRNLRALVQPRERAKGAG